MWATCTGAPVSAEAASTSSSAVHASAAGGAQVDEAGGARMRGGAKHFQDFPVRRGGRVLDSQADAGGAAREALRDLAAARGDLVIRSGAMCGIAGGQEAAGILHHAHAHRNVADRSAIIDQRLSLAVVVPGIHIGDAYLHFERGGDAVHGFIAVVFGVLAVGMQIDEAGRDHQSGGIDNGAAVQGRGGKGCDFAAGNAQIANGVEAAFGIEYPTAADDQIELLSAERRQQQDEPGCAHGNWLMRGEHGPDADGHHDHDRRSRRDQQAAPSSGAWDRRRRWRR